LTFLDPEDDKMARLDLKFHNVETAAGVELVLPERVLPRWRRFP
jgi:hypothetical protein